MTDKEKSDLVAFTIRVSKSINEKIRKECYEKNLSKNALVNTIIRAYFQTSQVEQPNDYIS